MFLLSCCYIFAFRTCRLNIAQVNLRVSFEDIFLFYEEEAGYLASENEDRDRKKTQKCPDNIPLLENLDNCLLISNAFL